MPLAGANEGSHLHTCRMSTLITPVHTPLVTQRGSMYLGHS